MTFGILLLPSLVLGAKYTHRTNYLDGAFFDHWDFISSDDPTHGFVDYVTKEVALKEELIRDEPSGIFIGVNNRSVVPRTARGRQSVRLESNRRYNEGLFIITLSHAPVSCGSWPALWMFGEDEDHQWPQWGEFDIIEWVHEEDQASAALHSKPGCSQKHLTDEQMSAKWSHGKIPSVHAKDCYVLAEDQWMNQGCSQQAAPGSIGYGFNQQGGGTFAADWDPKAGHMRIWNWPKGLEPLDVVKKEPQPEQWGKPQFFFDLQENCEPEHFKNMKLVFDITFCGDRAGGTTFDAHCGHMVNENETCIDFVRTNFSAFDEAYWSVQVLDVYQMDRLDSSSGHPLAAWMSLLLIIMVIRT